MHGIIGKNGKLRRPLTEEDLELYERLAYANARADFYAYRQLINPGLIDGWYQRRVAHELQKFYARWRNGERPVLVLEAPPQHGKSSQIHDFITWASGKHPKLKTIYTSYSDDLGLVANQRLQRVYGGEQFAGAFPKAAETWRNSKGVTRNTYHLESEAGGGEFRNTTVRGQITGMGLELGVIDDPIKGREEASSETIRDKTWFWFTDDFFSRFTETAAMLMIMTRWHLDDPVGRFLERYPEAVVLKFPAFGRFVRARPEDDTDYVKTLDGRYWIAENENDDKARPLFPELKSKRFLMKRKGVLTIGSWMSLYQQSPIVVGGDQFPIEKMTIVDTVPSEDQIIRTVRYWDKAGTKKKSATATGGAATAGVLMHELNDRRFFIEDVVIGWWGANDREKRIKQVADIDNQDRIVETYVEQEPGSGGKESAENTISNLRGHRVYADRVTGAKEVRCEPYAAQVQAGNVCMLEAPWNKAFLDEHEQWPNGKRKDMVDAAGGAFVKITVRGSSYDTTMEWAQN
jgi:predicted phage terminase large subunit-like protein